MRTNPDYTNEECLKYDLENIIDINKKENKIAGILSSTIFLPINIILLHHLLAYIFCKYNNNLSLDLSFYLFNIFFK